MVSPDNAIPVVSDLNGVISANELIHWCLFADFLAFFLSPTITSAVLESKIDQKLESPSLQCLRKCQEIPSPEVEDAGRSVAGFKNFYRNKEVLPTLGGIAVTLWLMITTHPHKKHWNQRTRPMEYPSSFLAMNPKSGEMKSYTPKVLARANKALLEIMTNLQIDIVS